MKMKLTLVGLISFLMLAGLTCCDESGKIKNPYTLPDIYNYKLEDVKEMLVDNVNLNVVNEPTYKVIEGQVLGYENLEAGTVIEKGSDVTIHVGVKSEGALIPDDKNPYIDYVSWLYKVTGPESTNAEMCEEHGVSGCDLGIPFKLPDGRCMLLYGDTFSAPKKIGYWNSNYMAISSDTDFTDGFTFDELVCRPNGMVMPFAQGAHQNDDEFNKLVEVTKIPTGAITVNGTAYIFYMSVRYWGGPTGWLVTYNQCVKATNDEYTEWVEVPSLRWTDDELYWAGQIYPIDEPNNPDYVYFVSIPGGRTQPPVMFRVKKDSFENRDQYEYMVAQDQFVKGNEGMRQLNQNPFFLFPDSSGEPGVTFSPYLKKYIYLDTSGWSVHMHLADKITGPWSESYTIMDSRTADTSIYGSYFYNDHSDYDGKRLFMQISKWEPYYDTFVCEVVFK